MSTQSFVVQVAAIAWVLAGSAAFSQAPRAADPAAAVAPPALNGPIVKVSQGEVQGTAAGGPMWPKFDAADKYVMEFPATVIPLAAKHFHEDRLDWVEVSLAK